MQKALIWVGLLLILIGVLWPWLGKFPLGRLPGDIVIDRPDMKFYVPITSMLLVSAIVSIIVWLFKK